MLPNRLEVEDRDIKGFEDARNLAHRTAEKSLKDPMLLAWFDSKTGAFSPQVECCSEEKPGWVVYAESRGGDLTVDVNKGEFYFIFREGASTEP